MKEIGGYIELDEPRGEEYHCGAVAVNSGRHALEHLIRAKNITRLYIPYFLCASIRRLCEKCGCKYEYYEVCEDFRPMFEKEISDDEYLYIVNYYGQLKAEEIQHYKIRFKNIIIDNAQAFFDMPIKGVNTIYTCRKFFGVSDGGYVYTDVLLKDTIEVDVSYERIQYILGRYEIDAGTFYKESAENNKAFANEPLKYMSRLTHNLLARLDYKYIAEKRTANYKCLHEHLGAKNKLRLSVPYGAFMYPFYTENAAKLRRYLISKKVFVPTLWADVFDVVEKDSVSWKLAENIVPLPIDQRYDVSDMEYIAEQLKGVLHNGV